MTIMMVDEMSAGKFSVIALPAIVGDGHWVELTSPEGVELEGAYTAEELVCIAELLTHVAQEMLECE